MSSEPTRHRLLAREAPLAALAAVLLCALVQLLGPSPLRAAGAELIDATVSPEQGTTEASFVFRVGYVSSPVRDALSVSAEIVDAGMTLDLALIGGSARNGTWETTSQRHVPPE